MAGDEQAIYRLSDLDVEAIGLVRRGANRKPFYFVKSIEGGIEPMSDTNEGAFSEQLAELEGVKEVNEGAWAKLVAVVKAVAGKTEEKPEPEPEPKPDPEQFAELDDADKKAIGAMLRAVGKDKLGDRTWAMLSALVGNAPPKPPENASDEVSAQFAEKFSAMEAQFAEQLEAERKKREEFAEKFAAEQRLRRLREFSDTVRQDFASLPVGEADEFAADMMAIHDADEKRYERLVKVLKASQEAVKQGGLFEQYSSSQQVEHGEPFLVAVEKIRVERFADKGKDVGWAEAFGAAMHEHPDLARVYEKATR